MKLRSILFLLSFLTILSVAVGGYLGYTFLKTNTFQVSKQTTALNSERLKSRFTACFDKHYKMVKTLAGLDEIRNALLTGEPQALQRANAMLDHFKIALAVDVCYLMDHSGDTIATSNRHATDSFEGKNYAFRPYFQEAMQNRDKVSYMALGVTSGRRGMYFSHPVYWKNDPSPIGVVVIKASVERIENTIMQDYEETAMLVSPQGIVFMSNRPSWRLKTLSPLTDADKARLRRTRQFGNGPWPWTGLTVAEGGRATDAAGRPYHIHETSIAGHPGWRLLYLCDTHAVFQRLSSPLVRLSGYVIPLVCLFVGIIALLLYRKMRHDLFQQRLSDEALEKSRETEKVLLNATTDQAILLDGNGKVLAVNDPCAERLGMDAGACIGLNAFDLFLPDAADRIRELLDRAAKTAQSATVTYTSDGQWFEVNAYPVLGNHGYPSRVALFRREITEQKQAEEILVQAKETAEAANRAKSEFLSNMSHELRSPMTVILGYSQMMREDDTFPPQHLDNLDAINKSGKHLLSLINDALHFSRIEARKESLNVTTIDLHALIREMESMFRIKAGKKDLTLEVFWMADVPRYVAADEKKFRQILINLLTNAVEFTDRGGVTLRLSRETMDAGTMKLRIEVTDTGAGIAEADKEKVFGHFQQTASGRKSEAGSGLGLAISRAYARLMGGDITVQSTPGQGSTFTLEIAVAEGAASEIDQKAETPRVTGLAPGQAVPRIIVAEDIPESRNLLVRILRKAGMEVREAANGQEAVNLTRQWHPDFIWMDIRMPLMDGLTATRIIKADAEAPVIAALTAHAFEEEKTIVLSAGCDDFVRKPYKSREIFEVMAKHLNLKYQYGGRVTEPSNNTVESAPGASDRNPDQNPDVNPALKTERPVPPDLAKRLRNALAEGDRSLILMLIARIKERNPVVGGKLMGLAQTFDYDEILNHLERGSGSPPET
ncbi:MAG: ATP-binding protein [Thermodesulfobacteriota bacterium]|nr:ATP-binding protein [Thermodesulfobacteriota bacterium]